MPYLGRAPTGTGSVTEIDGDLTVTGNIKSGGQLTSNDTLFKQIMDGTDGSSTNARDNIIIEDGGTDGSGTNAGDDICLEKDMQVVPAGDIISISGVTGGSSADETIQAWAHITGTGTIAIDDSFNVSGITDAGTGKYTFTFDTDFASISYAATGSVNGSQGIITNYLNATTDSQMRCFTASNGAVSDHGSVSVIFSGDQ